MVDVDYAAAVRDHGSKAAAARALNIPVSTLKDRLRKFPELPSPDEPIDILRARLRENFERRQARRTAEHWLPLTLPEAGAFAFVWFGDPHLGDDDCNMPLLEQHIATCRQPGIYGACVGDYSNNWVGRLLRKYGDQATTKGAERELIKWFAKDCGVDWRLWLAGNHDCVTPDHEVMTRRGWVKFPEVRPDDVVLGFDAAAKRSVWQKINEVVSFPYEGPLLSYQTKRFAIRCTPNHRFLHKRNRKGDFQYGEAKDLPREYTVALAAETGAQGVALSDDQISLAAWVLTDGYVTADGYIRISQSKPEGLKAIEALLARLGYQYSVQTRHRSVAPIRGVAVKSALPENTIALTAAASRDLARNVLRHKKSMPSWAQDLSTAQFEVFLATLVDANGTRYATGQNDGTAILYGRVEQLNEIQALCVSHGYAASLVADNRGDPRLNICRKTTADIVGFPTVEHYAGQVWCLRVPLSNFMVRYKGYAHFTGNSWNEGEAILGLIVDQAFYVASWEARVTLRTSQSEWKVHTAHSFPGHSMWNTNHGGLKAAKMNSPAELFVEGHTHNYGLQSFEKPGDGRVANLVQTRGYKWHDDYALVKGFHQGQSGASVMTIFNPHAKTAAGRITSFGDIEMGADFLRFLRQDKPNGGKPTRRR